MFNIIWLFSSVTEYTLVSSKAIAEYQTPPDSSHCFQLVTLCHEVRETSLPRILLSIHWGKDIGSAVRVSVAREGEPWYRVLEHYAQ
jgi:hypothetical protein